MPALIRIFLRYATFPFLYYGLINENEASDLIADPEIAQTISLWLGLLSPVIAEGWYYLARKFGWRT